MQCKAVYVTAAHTIRRSRYVVPDTFSTYAVLGSCQHPRRHQSIIRASVATATFTWVLRVDKITPCLLYIRSARLLVYQPRTSRHPGDTHPSDTEWAYSPLTIFQSGHSPLTIFQSGHSPLTIFDFRHNTGIASRLWGELPLYWT